MRRPEARAFGRVAAALGAAILAAAAPARAADPDTRARVESRLMCYCGCTDLTVKVCNCGTAANIKADIAARLDAGATADQVVDAYVAQYGEQIRSAPTRSGFNLLAWIMPFAVILAGGLMVVSLVRRWRGAPGAVPAPDAAVPAGADTGARAAGSAGRSAEAEARLRERVEREIRESL
ncbi:MAG TPA: cytochrome c-type biogenesis protein CcmH [Dongiaceae bacterium]|nr:cytochrome c-type biogenesis protein CcmH [Dongiaceae bacterium]